MRKLVLPIAGILSCMLVTAVVVSELAQPKQAIAPASSTTESAPQRPQKIAQAVMPGSLPIKSQPSRELVQAQQQLPLWQSPVLADSEYAQPRIQQSVAQRQTVTRPTPTQTKLNEYPSTGAPAFDLSATDQSPRLIPLPDQPTPPGTFPTENHRAEKQQPALGQPGIGFANGGAAGQPARFAQDYQQPDGGVIPYQLTSSVQMAANYDNAISPDEDLLQGAGITPPASTSPAAPYVPATPVTPNNVPLTPPKTLPPESLPPESLPPAIEPTPPGLGTRTTEDLLDQLPSENLPSQNMSTRRLPPTEPPATTPATPKTSVPQAQPTPPQQNQVTNPTRPISSPATPSQPSADGGWSKDTPPGPDEDLLSGEVGELPAPGDNVRLPLQGDTPETAPPVDPAQTTQQDNTPQTTTPPVTSPFTTAPNNKQPLPKGPPSSGGMAPHGKTTPKEPLEPGVDPHLELYAKNCFPSAKECKTCHEKIYDEWAGSSHAYASISPMFQKFEQTIHGLAMGTISHFCMRCHAPVATALAHPREASIWDSIPAAREGVTCIACHRVNENYGKVNGERRIEMGDISKPMYGAGYGQKLAEMIENKGTYKIKTEPGEKGPGVNIHTKVIHFDQIADSSFCVSCHQVAVAPGIALEVVWAQYRASPACKQGITCQECHMGREPGVAAGFTTSPVAVVNGKDISPGRKHSNHMFYGPGYSIAHPGLFPHNEKAEEWTMQEWLEFDYRAGWGTEKFEELVDDKKINVTFPSNWSNADDRADAREVVDKNLGKLEEKRHMRHRLMENGSHLEGPIFKRDPQAGRKLQFRYDVTNTNPGHNMPSGSLGAQPQVWLNVALTGPDGQHLWESGYVDRNGDIADVHSLEVAAGRIQRDFQLFNLQTKFLITGVKGTDREMYLPVNTDFDQLPFIRASGFPVTVMNHPPFIRMEAHSIPPLGTMQAKYSVPADRMQKPGVYKLSVRMRSRAEPIYFMRFCKATPEMERNMNYWMLDYHEETFRFMVH